MKKFLYLLVSIAFVFTACSDKTADSNSENAQKNLDAFHKVVKAFETGDVSGIDSVVADDFIDHTERGDFGRDSLKAWITMMNQVDPTMKSEVVRQMADDEYVMAWLKYTGTGDGSMMPAGPYTMNAIEVVRFKDGKGVEHWSFMETREAMQMMNPGVTAPGNTTPVTSDTANK